MSKVVLCPGAIPLQPVREVAIPILSDGYDWKAFPKACTAYHILVGSLHFS